MTNSSPTTPDLGAQKAILRRRLAPRAGNAGQFWASLDRAQDLYFDRVAQIQMPSWSCAADIALVGDAASCVSLMAGQGSALAMTAAYALAGELAKAGGRHDEAFSRDRVAAPRAFIDSKQKGAERFSGAFAPRTRFGLFLAKSGDPGVRYSGSSEARIEPRHRGHAATSRRYSWPAAA